jgi:uncharacterized protein with von Willebrand factor type A (vWA) domain
MERYARLLLAFLHAATSTRRHAGLRRQVFSFGTELRDLGPAFAEADTDAMLARANAAIADFGGGTRMGRSLGQLRRQHARHLVGRRTLVLIVSDGLDTGDPAELDRELAWLRRHSARLLWLNPLLRFDGMPHWPRGQACCIVMPMPCLRFTTWSRCSSWPPTWRGCWQRQGAESLVAAPIAERICHGNASQPFPCRQPAAGLGGAQ